MNETDDETKDVDSGTDEGDDGDSTLTDLGSTCSGLTDLSGLSDLDFQLPEPPEGTTDAGAEDTELGVVEFGMSNDTGCGKKRKNMWRKKLEKRKRIKHQQ
ncbi:unnamed protein product [Gongylonema pulchrum]|uniref:Uncharacterized protein n=1 Tax=Gongylonema pulchrum TaxID=637853 RepID=A0A3P7MM57_9BILA|nr:unnamed protein product [Gongylonema pulchrum]